MKNIILVYTGPGVSPGVEHAIDLINKVSSPFYKIKKASPYMLKNQDWEANTTLLVMPGGRDIPYLEELKEKGNNKIKNFVVNGGSYLGICAGAYYGSSHVSFAKGTSLEVEGDRPLKFFPGTCYGPTFSGFQYNSDSGAKAALIKTNINGFSKYLKTYYNGGGFFSQAQIFKNITTLAYYEEKQDDNAAIILSKVGNGVAILTGVHLETKVSSDHFLFQDLEPYFKDQEILFSMILEKLGIQLKPNIEADLLFTTTLRFSMLLRIIRYILGFES